MLHLSGNYVRSENFSQKIRNVLGRKNTADGACSFSGWRFRENHQYQIYLSYENCKFRHNALSGELLYGAAPRR